MPRHLALTGRPRRGALTALYVTNELPWPPHSGGQLREAQLLARLGKAVDIDLFVLTESYERDAAHAELALEHCRGLRLFETAPAPSAGPDRDTPERVWRYQSAAFDAAVAGYLAAEPPDVVHAEHYFLAARLPADLVVPLVVLAENVEYLIDRARERAGLARGAPWPLSRDREYAVLSRATLCGAVCQEDADIFLADAPSLPVLVFPNGGDHLRAGDEPPAGPPAGPRDARERVTFVGNYGWEPTLDGAWSLVRDIWPLVAAAHPAARLVLAGAGMPDDLRLAAAAVTGIEAVGQVPDVRPLLAATDIFACPLWVPSGIKVKMLEALRVGCAVVCTRAALRGLPAGAARAVVLAEDPESFAAAIGALIDDPARRRELAERARNALTTFPTWDDAAERLLRGWRQAIASGAQRSGGEEPGPVPS